MIKNKRSSQPIEHKNCATKANTFNMEYTKQVWLSKLRGKILEDQQMWVPFLCMFKICHGMKICHDLWPTDVLFPTNVGKLHRFSLTFFIEWGRRDATGVLPSRLGLPPDSSASNSLKTKAFCSLIWWHDLATKLYHTHTQGSWRFWRANTQGVTPSQWGMRVTS